MPRVRRIGSRLVAGGGSIFDLVHISRSHKHQIESVRDLVPEDDVEDDTEDDVEEDDNDDKSSSVPSSTLPSGSEMENSTVGSENSECCSPPNQEKPKQAGADLADAAADTEKSDDDPTREMSRKATEAEDKTSDKTDCETDKKKKPRKRRPSKPEFFRGDQVWDRKTNSFKLKKTAERTDKDEYGKYIFHVRRCFNSRGELHQTMVDVKSRTLKKLLEIVMGSCKDVSFAEAEPEIEPNMIFLYLEDLRAFRNQISLESEAEMEEKRKKKLSEYAALLTCLLEYMDKDYERLKARLQSLIDQGDITYDLLWTLFRSDDIAYLPTYSTPEEPRAIQVNFTYQTNHIMKGMCFCIDGEYFNYDGKNFGLSTNIPQIDQFEGTRRITSLPCYPMKYHTSSEEVQKQLVQRGKKFLKLIGTNYRSHEGLGFMHRDQKVIKVSVSSRIMIDSLVFRRIDPNYPVPSVKTETSSRKPKDYNSHENNEGESDFTRWQREIDAKHNSPPALKLVLDKAQQPQLFEIRIDSNGEQIQPEALTELLAAGGVIKRDFTEKELLISSPVVYGFAFAHKLWLEFTVSGIEDIEWNEGAFESLVLPERQKSLIKALVTSHASVGHGRDTIDDVIKGKGKGLVAVLHGTPGVGKTLTAEGIAELLRRPLYYVSAGELGTHPRDLETELTKILDVAQTWGAVLLLDEAEVFLEARTAHDIHRNALVSIFLRVLEYFQGIIFLTSNRVACFDPAFQSRIHFALRYQDLDFQARRSIFKMFIERVVEFSEQKKAVASNAEGDKGKAAQPAVASFSEAELDRLARRSNINGRQIKNAVRSAQALALADNVPMNVAHVLRVLEIAETFEQDLKGGTGYMDAMRSYT